MNTNIITRAELDAMREIRAALERLSPSVRMKVLRQVKEEHYANKRPNRQEAE